MDPEPGSMESGGWGVGGEWARGAREDLAKEMTVTQVSFALCVSPVKEEEEIELS